MSREEVEAEFAYLLRSVIGRDLGKWTQPPSAILARAALRHDTAILEGVFGYQRTLTDIGVGKSVYALKTLYHVYDRRWEIARRYVVFMPQEFIEVFEWAVDNRAKIPALVWDDAGMWLGKMRWQNEFVKTVKEFLNVVRTHVAYIIFTAPTVGELARGIRERLRLFTFVRRFWTAADIRKATSQASYYTSSMLEEKRGRSMPPPIATYYFKLFFEHYGDYRERRDSYVKIGLERMRSRLKYVAERASEELREIMKKVEAGRMEPVYEPEEYALEIEELEEGDEDG